MYFGAKQRFPRKEVGHCAMFPGVAGPVLFFVRPQVTKDYKEPGNAEMIVHF